MRRHMLTCRHCQHAHTPAMGSPKPPKPIPPPPPVTQTAADVGLAAKNEKAQQARRYSFDKTLLAANPAAAVKATLG